MNAAFAFGRLRAAQPIQAGTRFLTVAALRTQGHQRGIVPLAQVSLWCQPADEVTV